MDKTNLSLITALVDTEDSNLYRDIYFPIIKYVVVDMYYEDKESPKHYFEIKELQDGISKLFGIRIPIIVLQYCINNFKNYPMGLEIKSIENGKEFDVRTVYDIYGNAEIYTKSVSINDSIEKLEGLFQKYLAAEKIESQKKIVDLFSDNTEDVMAYFKSEDTDVRLNVEYANLLRFITWVKETNPHLYSLVDSVFFASLVAGFLQRNISDPDIKAVEKVDYYLDTSLIMSLLELSNDDAILYAKELVSVIKGAGSCPRIHAMTAREVSNILQSVIDAGGPWVGSAMESAYYKRQLSPVRLIERKRDFLKELEGLGVVYTPMSEKDIDTAIQNYKNKPLVCELADQRFSSQSQRFREIHDIYLHDYVQKLNKNIVSNEKLKAYFVSINSDLISLFKDRETPLCIMHSAKVVMNLWMHTSRSTIVRKSALTLAMSRCFATNNQDVRKKLNAVLAYYDPERKRPKEEIQAIYKVLIHRSQNVMKNAEEIIENEKTKNPDYYQKNELLAKAIVEVSLSETEERETSLMEMEALKHSIESVQVGLNEVTTKLNDTQSQLTEKDSQLSLAIQEKEKAEIEAKEAHENNEMLTKKIALQTEIRSLDQMITKCSSEIETMKNQRNDYIKKNDRRLIYTVLEVILLVLCICSVGTIIYGFSTSNDNITFWSFIAAVPSLSVYLIAFTRSKSFIFDRERAVDVIEEDLSKRWNKQHPEYREKTEELQSYKAELEEKEKTFEEL